MLPSTKGQIFLYYKHGKKWNYFRPFRYIDRTFLTIIMTVVHVSCMLKAKFQEVHWAMHYSDIYTFNPNDICTLRHRLGSYYLHRYHFIDQTVFWVQYKRVTYISLSVTSVSMTVGNDFPNSWKATVNISASCNCSIWNSRKFMLIYGNSIFWSFIATHRNNTIVLKCCL